MFKIIKLANKNACFDSKKKKKKKIKSVNKYFLCTCKSRV